MSSGAKYKVPLRRRREGRTDYGQRLALLKSGKPRLVVRKTNNHALVQLVEAGEQGDRTLAHAHTSELRDHGWEAPTGNLPAAYLVGYLGGSRAVEHADEAVLDIGVNSVTPQNRVFAALKGAVDAGLDVPHGEEVLPAWERVRGEHIAEGVEYEAREVDAGDVPGMFDDVLAELEETA
ncbi:MAG: 50S ribosomal protein L18 [Halobacteriales archaeon]